MIYRGYDIEPKDAGYWATKDGEGHHFETEDAAMAWIDAQRRAAAVKKQEQR